MSFPPVIAALRKHKTGTLLIGLQIALTLAIVCNLIFLVALRIERIQRPTGMDERDLFLITQTYAHAPTGGSSAIEQLDSMQLTDLAALRNQPNILSVTPVTSLPLSYSYGTSQVALKPDQPQGVARVNLFTGDQYAIETLGLHLVSGRNFSSTEVQHGVTLAHHEPAAIMVTQALANRLFPNDDALGKPVYLDGGEQPSMIIGVLAAMLSSNPDAPDSIAWNSVLIPARFDSASTMYAVRAKPGRMQTAMQEAHKTLYAIDPMRVVPQPTQWDPEGIASFAHWRRVGTRLDSMSAQVLAMMCVILLLITGIGITGLTSFWVRQRHKQIGTRRALGATQANILHYFQIENLIISSSGCVVGIVTAILINLALIKMFAMQRMPLWYVVMGVLVILSLGQLAVFVPARRASYVPPLVATRSGV